MFHTMTLVMSRAVMVARARPMPEAPGSPGAALHRSVLQHRVFMVRRVLFDSGGNSTVVVLLQPSSARQPFTLKSTKLTADTRDNVYCISFQSHICAIINLFA